MYKGYPKCSHCGRPLEICQEWMCSERIAAVQAQTSDCRRRLDHIDRICKEQAGRWPLDANAPTPGLSKPRIIQEHDMQHSRGVQWVVGPHQYRIVAVLEGEGDGRRMVKAVEYRLFGTWGQVANRSTNAADWVLSRRRFPAGADGHTAAHTYAKHLLRPGSREGWGNTEYMP